MLMESNKKEQGQRQPNRLRSLSAQLDSATVSDKQRCELRVGTMSTMSCQLSCLWVCQIQHRCYDSNSNSQRHVCVWVCVGYGVCVGVRPRNICLCNERVIIANGTNSNVCCTSALTTTTTRTPAIRGSNQSCRPDCHIPCKVKSCRRKALRYQSTFSLVQHAPTASRQPVDAVVGLI